MKKQSILLLISVLALSAFFSCTSKTVKTEEKDLIERHYLTKDTTKGSLNLDLEIEIPTEFCDTNVLNSIRATLITHLFGEDYIHVPNDSLVRFYANELLSDYRLDNLESLKKLDKGSHYSFNNEQVISGFSLLSDKKIYVYGIVRYAYMGGAHGMETHNYFNFDLKTGKQITEEDLFKPGYQSKLSELIKTRIVEDLKQSPNERNSEPVETLDDTDFWTDSIKSNGNFYITDESINYVFNPYEIAPYYMGQTEVVIPFSRLKHMLKPDCIISYLIEKYEKSAK